MNTHILVATFTVTVTVVHKKSQNELPVWWARFSFQVSYAR